VDKKLKHKTVKPGGHRAHRAAKWVTLTLVLLAALASIVPTLVVHGLARPHTSDVADVQAQDVTLVMGAAMWGGQPSPSLQQRLDVVAQLYKTGKTKVIIVSGHVDHSYNEPKGMRAALVAQGVPASRIVLDPAGDDTYSSCARARDVYGLTSLIVVTQTYHLPRAVATCRLLGIDATGVGTGQVSHNATWLRYALREVAANAKLMLDTAVNRQVAVGGPSAAVQKALSGG